MPTEAEEGRGAPVPCLVVVVAPEIPGKNRLDRRRPRQEARIRIDLAAKVVQDLRELSVSMGKWLLAERPIRVAEAPVAAVRASSTLPD